MRARASSSSAAYYEAALQAIAPRVPLRAIEIDARGEVIEIDFPEDLKRARESIYPRISRSLVQDVTH